MSRQILPRSVRNPAILILAAGSSSRLGKPKQLLVYQQETLIKQVVKIALQIQQKNIFIVSGFLQEELKIELQNFQIQFIHNPNWAEGIGSSIKTGVTEISKNPEIDSVLILLSDQPLISSAHLRQLIVQFYADKNSTIIATNYVGVNGVPAIFDQQLFADLLQLPADRGASWFFKNYEKQFTTINFEDAAIDIDTVADYENLLKLSNENKFD